jgi:hypothetical protein
MWKNFLREVATKYELTEIEAKTLMCLTESSITRNELLNSYNEIYFQEDGELTIEALAKRLTNVYNKFQVRNRTNKFRILLDLLRTLYQKWLENNCLLRTDLINIYPKFSREKFRNELKKVCDLNDEEKFIDILQTFEPYLKDYQEELINCINNNVYIRISLAWPYSVAARLRGDVLSKYLQSNDSQVNVKHEVISNLEVLETILNQVGETEYLKIKLYDTLPSLAIYRFGKYMIAGIFSHTALAVNTFQLELNTAAANPIISMTLKNDFQVVWDIAKKFSPSSDRNWRNDLENLF